jgi:hypothetical protein
MLRSEILAEKEAILRRLELAKRRRDIAEIRRRLGELHYFTHVEDDAGLVPTRLDWLDQRRVASVPRNASGQIASDQFADLRATSIHITRST